MRQRDRDVARSVQHVGGNDHVVRRPLEALLHRIGSDIERPEPHVWMRDTEDALRCPATTPARYRCSDRTPAAVSVARLARTAAVVPPVPAPISSTDTCRRCAQHAAIDERLDGVRGERVEEAGDDILRVDILDKSR